MLLGCVFNLIQDAFYKIMGFFKVFVKRNFELCQFQKYHILISLLMLFLAITYYFKEKHLGK